MDKERFKRIWLPFSDRFYRVAYYILEDRAEAEDAVQDLFVRLWNRRSEEVLNPFAYGVSVLKNICLDKVRRRHGGSVDDEEAEAVMDNIPGPDEALVNRDSLRRLGELIEELPENQRNVLEMRVYKSMSYEDISRATGLSEVHLRVLLSAARKTLRQKMEALK